MLRRDKLNKALKELKLQMTDIFDPQKAKEVGKFIGADLLFLIEGYIGEDKADGRAFDCDDPITGHRGSFRVKVLVIDVKTAEVKGMWKKFITKQD